MSNQVIWICVISFIFFSNCGIDRSINIITADESLQLSKFNQLDSIHQVSLAPGNEPGQKLQLALSFVDKDRMHPLQNQSVAFYHTSAEGEYQPTNPNDESTARLSGRATTNRDGRILVHTILPGDYGSSADNRHIHTTVFGAHPEAYDLHFKQYTTAMGKRFINGSDQHFLVNLQKDSSGNLLGFHTIEVKSPRSK